MFSIVNRAVMAHWPNCGVSWSRLEADLHVEDYRARGMTVDLK